MDFTFYMKNNEAKIVHVQFRIVSMGFMINFVLIYYRPKTMDFSLYFQSRFAVI